MRCDVVSYNLNGIMDNGRNTYSLLFMLGGAVLALLLAGYFAQQYLPPPKPKVVGIDLGMAVQNCLSIYICEQSVVIKIQYFSHCCIT